jgi:metal-dependent amidase/aminoacylase/carboxypeptidase family protein
MPTETEFAGDIASAIAGEANVNRAMAPVMGGEDFSYMLEARPGAFIFIGNGDSANLHHPAYDFNDEAIPHGVSYWVLAETALPKRRWPPSRQTSWRIRPEAVMCRP